jgi:hypothetical protein
MLQLIIVLVCLTLVLLYVIRHYVKVFRSEVPTCSGCTGCPGASKSTCDSSESPKPDSDQS